MQRQNQHAPPDDDGFVLERGMPTNVDAERFVLGSILLDDSQFIPVASQLEPEDFSLQKHQLIFTRMCELNARDAKIDRITVANELMGRGELEKVDGLTYLVSLDDGMPQLPNIDSYVRIVKDKAMLRRIAFSGRALMERAISGEEDPQKILAAAGESLLKMSVDDNREGPVLLSDVIQRFPGGINAMFDPSKRAKGLATGFTKFDEMTGGFREGELIILAARPSMGKTALALNIASHVGLKLFKRPVIFSLEMSAESLLSRFICAEANVDSQKYRAGYLNAAERLNLAKAATRLSDSQIHVDDSASSTVFDMHSKLRRMAAAGNGADLVIVDYLQLMSGNAGTKQENRNQEVSGISRGLKLMAKDLGVPVLALSQLSRAPETRPGDRRPQLSDLRESGSIEQDADLVAFIFREEVYKRDREDLRGLAELLVAKQRNGPIGKVDLVFLNMLTKFANRAEDLDPADAGLLPASYDTASDA